MTRQWLLALAAGLLTLHAAARADEIDEAARTTVELDSRIHSLDQQLRPPPEPGPETAERRLIDAQVLYQLKNYEAASIVLFDVVDKYPTASVYPEALYYLADSLYQNRDFLSAKRFFDKIVSTGTSNPHYQEALERLIELSLHTGDYSPVDEYISKLESMPPQQMLPSVPYVKGKYFFFRQKYDDAIAALKPIGPGHPYYFNALYFIGASFVAKGPKTHDEAINVLQTLTKTPAPGDAQKRIVELAHMALARIFLDRGQLIAATNEYGRIGQRSELFNDSLYESAWVAIKNKDYKHAAQALDILLLNAPESTLAPEVKLLIGSLHLRQFEYTPAMDMFTKTRDEYEPIRKQLDEEVQKSGDAAYLRSIIAMNLSKLDTPTVLPPVANRWLKGEPDVQRLSALVGDVGSLRRSLDESDEIVRRLERALAGPARINVYPELAHARSAADEISNENLDIKRRMSAREAALFANLTGPDKQVYTDLESQRAELDKQLQHMPMRSDSTEERIRKARGGYLEVDKRASEIQSELNSMRETTTAMKRYYSEQTEKKLDAAERAVADKQIVTWSAILETLENRLRDLRRDTADAQVSIGSGDPEMQAANALKSRYDELFKRQREVARRLIAQLSGADRAKAEQIESVLEQARSVDDKIAAYEVRVDAVLDARLHDVRVALTEEQGRVAKYRDVLARYTGDSAEVGGAIVADNLKLVANRFYNVVVRADVGIIDIAWALKDSATKEQNRLMAERKREIKLLDDEFREVLKESP